MTATKLYLSKATDKERAAALIKTIDEMLEELKGKKIGATCHYNTIGATSYYNTLEKQK